MYLASSDIGQVVQAVDIVGICWYRGGGGVYKVVVRWCYRVGHFTPTHISLNFSQSTDVSQCLIHLIYAFDIPSQLHKFTSS